MKLVTTKFKSGGLHEKHVVADCSFMHIRTNTKVTISFFMSVCLSFRLTSTGRIFMKFDI